VAETILLFDNERTLLDQNAFVPTGSVLHALEVFKTTPLPLFRTVERGDAHPALDTVYIDQQFTKMSPAYCAALKKDRAIFPSFVPPMKNDGKIGVRGASLSCVKVTTPCPKPLDGTTLHATLRNTPSTCCIDAVYKEFPDDEFGVLHHNSVYNGRTLDLVCNIRNIAEGRKLTK